MTSFEFRQSAILLKSTGRKAGGLRELREGIASVSDGSIFHHIYQYFIKGHIREYTNDFAHWTGESLEERALAEQLSNIDPYDFQSIELLRKRLLEVIDDYFRRFPGPRLAMPGDEFYFNETVGLVYPAGVQVKNLAEFLMAIKYVDPASLYYHFYESRIRLGSALNDFSAWIDATLGKNDLARRIQSVDPFMHDIEGIREHIVEAVEDEVRKDIEIAGGQR